jgi:hypothetical protein
MIVAVLLFLDLVFYPIDPTICFCANIVRKNVTHKESSKKKVSRPRARFSGRLELPGWLGKDGAALTLG